MLDANLLATKKNVELRAMLVERGAGWKPAESKAELINRLVLIANTVQPKDRMTEQNQVDAVIKAPSPRLTGEQIAAVTKPYRDNGLELRISDDGQFWDMRYGIKQDSGNTATEEKVIKRCAEMLMKASSLPPEIKKSVFD